MGHFAQLNTNQVQQMINVCCVDLVLDKDSSHECWANWTGTR